MKLGVKTGFIAAAVVAAGIGACATSLKTSVGWDQHANFAKYHTWAWKPDGSIPGSGVGQALPGRSCPTSSPATA